MTETTQSLRDDIAFMRALADEGVRPPLTAGPNMMAAGLIWGGACFVAWAQVSFFKVTGFAMNYPFLAAMILFFIAMPFLIRRAKRAPGANSPANQATARAWMGAGWGIFVLAGCTALVCWRIHSALPVWVMPCGILILYGVAWGVSAAMIRDRFLGWVALASYASAAIIAFFANSPDMFLVFGFVLIAVALIPGYILWRREPNAVV